MHGLSPPAAGDPDAVEPTNLNPDGVREGLLDAPPVREEQATMGTVLQTLKEIHQLLVELEDVKTQLQRAPAQRQGRRNETAKKEQALVAARDELKHMKVASHEKEVGLKAGEQRLRDYKAKLNQAKSNKEFSALQDEIKLLQTNNGAIEEEVLLMMTDQETKAAEINEQAKQLDDAKKELAEFEKMMDYKVQKLNDRVGILEAKKSELEGQLDASTLTDYRRLLKTKGAGALAACDKGICQACYTAETPQAMNDLMMDRVVHCKSCGAILYTA